MNTIDVPPELLTKGEHFALEVPAISMIEAGILDGDTIIAPRDDARNRRYRRGAGRRGGSDLEAPRAEAIRSRSRPPTPLMRRASSGPTGCGCRAGSWG